MSRSQSGFHVRSGRGLFLLAFIVFLGTIVTVPKVKSQSAPVRESVAENALKLVRQGRDIFRFDTFGDEAFWGDTLKLHEAIEGAASGGVGPGLTPLTALTLGLKIDTDALPSNICEQLRHGNVNLNDPGVTVSLLRLNAVVGLTGIFDPGGALQSVGIQCAFCHSAVDNSNPELCAGAIQPNPGTGCVGHRLDGWANRDLNVGAIDRACPGSD
jgi:hypothetical protein